MDPRATLADLLAELSLQSPDRGVVEERLEALLEWIQRGGFLPKVERSWPPQPWEITATVRWGTPEEVSDD